MGGSCDENKENGSLLKQATSQGKMNLGGRKISGVENRQIRRPLGLINQNKVGGVQQNPLGVNKRSVSGISGRIPLPPHRPITRNFAAQIASSKPLVSQEIKKSKTSEDSFCVWVDTTITDVEEHVEAKDQPEPMSLEKRKEVSHENDQMEVEMEDIFEEPVVDIDIGDAKNPLAVTDYVEDLYAYYKNVEDSSSISLNYMDNQFDINANMRGVLVDWLIEVNHKFELRAETLFLNVNIIDRFLEKQCVERKRLQLVGLVAMLLACKYEEVSVPVLNDLVFISDKAYTRKDIIEMEALILNTLQFNMSVPTAFVFMKRYLKAAQSDKKLELLSFFLIELCLVEYEMIKFQPSFLAAAAIYAAQCTLYGPGQWDKTCEFHTNYSEEELLECAKMIASFHQKAARGKLTGVHRKYSTSKFGYASMCEPAKFLIEETHIRVRHHCSFKALYD